MQPEATLIKRDAVRHSPTRFSFVHVHDEARRMVDDAREEARQITARAHEEAARVIETARSAAESEGREQGYSAGHEHGLAQGLAEGRRQGAEAARSEFAQATAPAAQALASLVAELEQRRAALVDQARADLLTLSLDIARRLTGLAFNSRPEAAQRMAHELIAHCAQRTSLRLQLSPADASVLREHVPQLQNAFSDLRDLAIEESTDLSRGCARALHRDGEVSFDAQAALDALALELIGGAE